MEYLIEAPLGPWPESYASEGAGHHDDWLVGCISFKLHGGLIEGQEKLTAIETAPCVRCIK
jgi:hypothetical protein